MAGETVKTNAICLSIAPWSRTSHVVRWLTPSGPVATVVKGAERPKSFFLGQYDLNYTCEIVYYARSRGEAHALREASPLALREALRGDYRGLAVASYARALAGELAPPGADSAAWYELLARTLDRLEATVGAGRDNVAELVRLDLAALRLAGLSPDFSGYDRAAEWSAFGVETGSYAPADGARKIRIRREVAEFLANPSKKSENEKIPLDAARVISVFYHFHLDCAFDVRRAVLGLIS